MTKKQLIEAGYEVRESEINKNGVKMIGVAVSRDGSQIQPVFYNLDQYDSIEDFNKAYDNEISQVDFDINNLNRDIILQSSIICLRPVTDDNTILKGSFLDLEEYARFMISENTSMIINNAVADMYDITLKDIEANNKDIYDIKNIDDILGSETGIPMKVVQSKYNYGAAALLCNHILKKICNDNGWSECIIIPSSIHELIVIEYKEDMVTYAYQMVVEVNKTEVGIFDILSNRVYIYSVKEDVIF